MSSKKIKICHVTSAHKNNDVRIFQKECSSLAKKETYEVFLIAPGESYNSNGVQVIGVGDIASNRFNRMGRGVKKVYCEALALDADIYHFHDPELLPYAKKIKKLGKMVIFDSHEDVPEQIKEKEYIPMLLRGGVSFIYKIYQAYILKKLDAIISVTPHICKKLREVNPNTFMVTNYPILREEIFEPSNFDKGKIVFAGGVTEQWSHRYIIEAISELPEITYDIYGKAANEGYIQELSTLKGWEKTNYKGFQPFEVVQQELRTANIAMAICQYGENSAGKYGTLGNTKLFEAMQAGVPVIATDFTLWKEIIDKYQCGIYVEPKNVDAIKNAIQYLCEETEIARNMGKNGKKAILECYNWKNEEQTLFKLYKVIETKIKYGTQNNEQND